MAKSKGKKIIEAVIENETGTDIKEKLELPQVCLRYQYAIDLMMAKLRLMNADLSGACGRQVIRNMSSRIKTADSIIKKLIKKGRNVDFETAVTTLNDIAGVRVVCFFGDDIYRVADAVRSQKDLRLIKEKDYVKNPKKTGYQSVHLIVGVPFTYIDSTQEIRVELQIRSFAMDYWAELDNQMCYKKNVSEIENIGRETKNYSDVIAEVDSKMLELRKRICP